MESLLLPHVDSPEGARLGKPMSISEIMKFGADGELRVGEHDVVTLWSRVFEDVGPFAARSSVPLVQQCRSARRFLAP